MEEHIKLIHVYKWFKPETRDEQIEKKKRNKMFPEIGVPVPNDRDANDRYAWKRALTKLNPNAKTNSNSWYSVKIVSFPVLIKSLIFKWEWRGNVWQFTQNLTKISKTLGLNVKKQ